MKPLTTLFLVLFITIPTLQAQDRERTKYFNINYSPQKLKSTENSLEISNEYGGGITYGKTFYVHPKPIAGMVNFGIDASFIDINYSFYSDSDYDDYYDEEYKMDYHQAEIGMQVGPSVTVTPISRLQAHAYFRWSPCFSGIYDTDDSKFAGSFGSFFNTGLSVSYGVIGLGVEARWGQSKFKNVLNSAYTMDWDKWENYEDPVPNHKFKTTTTRVYIQFCF